MAGAQIIHNFLASAPPGEFDVCYADIKGLLGGGEHVFGAADLQEAQRVYDQDQMIGVQNGDHTVFIFLVSIVSIVHHSVGSFIKIQLARRRQLFGQQR